MNILDKIVQQTYKRLEVEKSQRSLKSMRAEAEQLAKASSDHTFERALATSGISFIGEIKRASPSRGLIAADFPYVQIAKEYEAAGARALSCLTEPVWFQGHTSYLRDIAHAVSLPVLRKDFIIDEYMIYQAKVLGASAVLLICSILDKGCLAAYRALCDELHLSALVEAHTKAEVECALRAGAQVVGVNNRNLDTLEVNLDTSKHLRSLVPPEVLFVAESGIHTRHDVECLALCGVDAFLVGETLMDAPDRYQALCALRGCLP